MSQACEHHAEHQHHGRDRQHECGGDEKRPVDLERAAQEALACRGLGAARHERAIGHGRGIAAEKHEHDVQYLRVFVGRLRAKLGDDPAAPRFILNEPGVGYRFLE